MKALESMATRNCRQLREALSAERSRCPCWLKLKFTIKLRLNSFCPWCKIHIPEESISTISMPIFGTWIILHTTDGRILYQSRDLHVIRPPRWQLGEGYKVKWSLPRRRQKRALCYDQATELILLGKFMLLRCHWQFHSIRLDSLIYCEVGCFIS